MLKKFRFLVHIGTEKTGTTTLQKTLLRNKNVLLSEGIYYRHGDNLIHSRDMVAACRNDKSGDEFFRSNGARYDGSPERFAGSIKASFDLEMKNLPENVRTIIISSEHFHSRVTDEAEIETLKSWLHPYASSVRVICYLRRQVDMITSLYTTFLKSGGSVTLSEFIGRKLNKNSHYCNYDVLLSKWAGVYGGGSMNVRLFDKEELINGCVVEDFLAQVGLGKIERIKKQRETNQSINHFGQVLLRELNSSRKKNNFIRPEDYASLRSSIVKHFEGKGQALAGDEARRLQSMFGESNENVRIKWFPERRTLFNLDFASNHQKQLTEQQEKCIGGVFKCLASDDDSS